LEAKGPVTAEDIADEDVELWLLKVPQKVRQKYITIFTADNQNAPIIINEQDLILFFSSKLVNSSKANTFVSTKCPTLMAS